MVYVMEEAARPLLWRLGRNPKGQRQAVIDIGSNSVRLIVYQVSGRSIVPRINEKVMAGLGEGLSNTGRLSEKGVESAMNALARFHAICSSLGITNIRAIATAAVREAEDGFEFCERIRRSTGIQVQILSGEEEAKFAALGVVAAQRNPTGLIGDLGGSSLELVSVENGVLATGETYKLGPLAMQDFMEASVAKREAAILKELRSRGDIAKRDQFIAVGGAWRAIAKTHMHHVGYSLHVLQSYTIPTAEAVAFCTELLDKKGKLQMLAKNVAGRRVNNLPLTAHVLKAVLEESAAKSLVISAYGLREGIVFSEMPDDFKRLDPLLAGVTSLVKPDSGQAGFSKCLNDFLRKVLSTLEPVFVDTPEQEERLIAASFILADIGAMMHPDHRADIARQLVLRGPYTGIDHVGRVFLGLISAFRYSRKFLPTELEVTVLTSEQIERARVIAHLVRVATEFSGRTERILRRGYLSVSDGYLNLHVRPQNQQLVSEGVEKRLSQAASLLGLEPRIAGPL